MISICTGSDDSCGGGLGMYSSPNRSVFLKGIGYSIGQGFHFRFVCLSAGEAIGYGTLVLQLSC